MTVGHRALVAYGRPDGRYDLHYSQWGAHRLRLARAIAPGAPFAGGAVDPDPTATGLAFEAVLERVDPVVHEAVYVVSPGADVAAYLPLPFGLVAVDDLLAGDAGGALVAVGPDPADAAYVRGWFEGTASALGDLVDAGALDRGAALARLEDALRRFAGGGRELVRLP